VDWRILFNEALHNLCSFANIDRVSKSRICRMHCRNGKCIQNFCQEAVREDILKMYTDESIILKW
jgi:hypothetical protein